MSLPGLLRFILVTLPLTNSVTVPVGFPLKLYELVGVLALGSLAVSGRIDLGRHHRVPLLWSIFFFASFFASAWGLYQVLDLDLSMLEWAHGRFHPLINTLFHFAYLAFDIGLMILVIHLLREGTLSQRDFCRWWLLGSLLAVGYAVALNLVLQAGLSPAVLLRWDEVQYMTVGGFQLARTGPFEEGNYFGFYLLASVVVALFGVRRWPDRLFRLALPILVLGVLITASPAALLGVLALIFLAVFLGQVPLWGKLSATAGGILLLVLMVQSGLFQTVIMDKFSLIFAGGVTDVTNVSLIQRMNESYHAWQMFLDHPFGVGMGNYGYFFGQYEDLYIWLVSDFASFKRIANNIYLEVLCEHGAPVFLFFLYILSFMLRRLIFARQYLVGAGFVLLGVYFLAFPTFRLSLIWVLWGWMVFLGTDPRVSALPLTTTTGEPGPSARGDRLEG